MILTEADFDAIQSHWVINTVSADDRRLVFDLIKERSASAVGCGVGFESRRGNEMSVEKEIEERKITFVALIHEAAAYDGLDALIRPDHADDPLARQSAAASHRAFEIRRLDKMSRDASERIFDTLKLSALAHISSREPDLQRWFEENPSAIKIPSVANAPWDRRLLYRLFDCWIRLLRTKDDRNNLDYVKKTIAGLRKEQQYHEKVFLAKISRPRIRKTVQRLISFYYWIEATETFAEYMHLGEPPTILDDLNRSFQSGIDAATEPNDFEHQMTLHYLRAMSAILVMNSSW
ncbi:MAG: hypothetical protein ISN28_04650 [Ectothiorhodospiraceae bacterium AqS1]|nr:hypothetical protein [Ectothiorhodospiraceae bacterium AqS1]